MSGSYNPMDCSSPGSPVHGIISGKGMEWVAISFSRRSTQPRDQTQVFPIAGKLFAIWVTRETDTLYPLTNPSVHVNLDGKDGNYGYNYTLQSLEVAE